jgi:hypothetical protein
MNLISIIILNGFLIGAAGFVFAVPLQMPGEILSFVPTIAKHVPRWIAKPLITCQKCIAGQLSFWLFPFWICEQFSIEYDPFFHFFQVTTSIFFAVVITKMIDPPMIQAKAKWKPPEIN